MPSVKSEMSDPANAVQPGQTARKSVSSPDVIRRAYAGKYVAWAPDGISIVAVASSFEGAERKAAKAGYPQVAVAQIPKGRSIS